MYAIVMNGSPKLYNLARAPTCFFSRDLTGYPSVVSKQPVISLIFGLVVIYDFRQIGACANVNNLMTSNHEFYITPRCELFVSQYIR